MKNSLSKITKYLDTDLASLKNNATKVKLFYADEFEHDGEKISKRNYKWKLTSSILFFNEVEQIEYNKKPIAITLINNKASKNDIERVFYNLVRLLGEDEDKKGFFNEFDNLTISNNHSRSWKIGVNNMKVEMYLFLQSNKNSCRLQLLNTS